MRKSPQWHRISKFPHLKVFPLKMNDGTCSYREVPANRPIYSTNLCSRNGSNTHTQAEKVTLSSVIMKFDNPPSRKEHNCTSPSHTRTHTLTYFTAAIHALITSDWTACAVKIQTHFHFWHVFIFGALTGVWPFLIFWVKEAALARDHFHILVYSIMRCVCLIVYLESSASFIDSVARQTPPARRLLMWFCSVRWLREDATAASPSSWF